MYPKPTEMRIPVTWTPFSQKNSGIFRPFRSTTTKVALSHALPALPAHSIPVQLWEFFQTWLNCIQIKFCVSERCRFLLHEIVDVNLHECWLCPLCLMVNLQLDAGVAWKPSTRKYSKCFVSLLKSTRAGYVAGKAGWLSFQVKTLYDSMILCPGLSISFVCLGDGERRFGRVSNPAQTWQCKHVIRSACESAALENMEKGPMTELMRLCWGQRAIRKHRDSYCVTCEITIFCQWEETI